MSNASPESLEKNVLRFPINYVVLPPQLIRFFSTRPPAVLKKISSMTAILTGLAPVTAELQTEFMSRVADVCENRKPQVKVIQLWGMTESGGVMLEDGLI
jgi:acyl-coenzyme A synthetase/AMP-(fatty) acid ligase